MTEQEKQLLLKVLCAMLPYELHCRVFRLNGDIKENDDILYGVIGDNVVTLKSDKDECLMYYQVKPYLRPLSSMTNAERDRMRKDINKTHEDITDWLDKYHFDYRGLIKKGLALEAPEGMYKTK